MTISVDCSINDAFAIRGASSSGGVAAAVARLRFARGLRIIAAKITTASITCEVMVKVVQRVHSEKLTMTILYEIPATTSNLSLNTKERSENTPSKPVNDKRRVKLEFLPPRRSIIINGIDMPVTSLRL